jgi:subfamily B ATP-binding cassette protein MsbA
MRSLMRLKPYLMPFRWLILGSILLAFPLAAVQTGTAVLVQRLIDDLTYSKDASKLSLFPIWFIALYLFNFVVRFFHYYLIRIVVARADEALKNDLYSHLLGLSPDYYTEQSTGTLMSRAGSDPQLISGAVININAIFREPLRFIGLFVYALWLDWRLTIISFLIFPPLAWVFSATGRNIKRYIAGTTEQNARIYSTLQESFTGIRIVKAFNLEAYMRKKFQERTSKYADLLTRTGKIEEVAHPLVEFLTALVIAAVVYYGGQRVINGHMTPGELLAFFLAFALMMNPLRALNDINIKLNNAAAASERIFQIFDWKSHLVEPKSAAPISRIEREIRLENVSFAYPDSPARKVLDNVSFTIPAGKTLALVGASGSGKSSLVSLLPRIFDVTEGAIRIDGKDLREYRLGDLRSMIAVVSQDVFLFNDTIEENIRCGRLDASAEDIRKAARQANAFDFIERLPNGFETVIGDRGMKLSGGERQRLSIARAFLRTSPILILDEATSNLDSQSELAVQGALNELMRGKTTILVAHRLSTVRSADSIVVVKAGRLIEQGKHDELVKRGGEYAKFHELFQT